jgi:hypothetical protein
MRHTSRLRTPGLGILALLLALLLPACGGGGSNSDGTPTGSVALLVTDASVDDFTSIRMTVSRVDLLSPDLGRQNLWAGSETIDLLQLAEYSELFAVGDTVPAGTYDQIQIQVDKSSLVTEPPSAFSLNTDHINLNPQGGFPVTPGDTLYVKLDFDAAAMLNSADANDFLEPRVFVDILGAESGASQGLTRLRGEITGVSAGSFLLCHPLRGGDGEYCTTVVLPGPEWVFEGPEGVLTSGAVVDAADVGSVAVAYGTVDLASESLSAVIVEVGDETGAPFLKVPVRGHISAVAEGSLALLLDDGTTSVNVETGLARLFTCQGVELGPEDLLVGAEVRVDGIYVSDDTGGTLQATIVIVKVCGGS